MTTTIAIVLVAAVAFCLGRWYGRAERERAFWGTCRELTLSVVQTCPPNCPDCAANRGADAALDEEIKSNG